VIWQPKSDNEEYRATHQQSWQTMYVCSL
jgi:hypothetical protein